MREDFQFLNLSNPTNPVQQKNPSPAQEDRSIKILAFTMPLAAGGSEAEERNQARDQRLCTKIADELRAQGFDTGKVGPAKPWGAAFSVGFNRFTVEVMFISRRLSPFLKCEILTWASPSRWRRVHSESVLNEWARLQNAIEGGVRQILRGESARWVTDNELAEEEKAERVDFKANC